MTDRSDEVERVQERLAVVAKPPFRATVLPHLDELMTEYVESPEFDELLVHWIRLEVEPERQEEMIERCRRLVQEWAADQRAATGAR